jgi:Rrf2 family transcriptional regulator, iron-sulfur cluster assembly transcription factor
MISQTIRYALRIVGFLADHQGQWVQGREIAKATGIPANYLSKILNQLRKAGLVDSQKGWGGGFFIGDAALRTPIAEVLVALEGRRENGNCIFELRKCDADNPCPLHGYWERIRGEYDAMIRSVTIGDLRAGVGMGGNGGRRHYFW